jgi:WS/DGAT/MGAT family acyltransferase
LALDPDFDVDVHVHRYSLPEGSGWNELLGDARRMSLTDFDRNRPLWEAVLIDGLPNGEAAFIMKLHHSIADGQATVIMALSLFELGLDPNPEDPPTPEVPDGEDVGTLDIAKANLEDNLQRIKGSAEGLLRAGGQMMRQAISDPTGSLDTVRSTVDSITRAVAMPDAALSPVWSERGTTYHFGAFEFPFDGLKQAAKSRGLSVNDAFMAAVASALDRYHDRHGYEVPRLRVNVPISLRGDAGDRSGQASNAVSIARLEMPVAGLSIDELMAEAHELVDAWRGAPATRMADPLADVSWFVPVPVLAQAARASDLTTSNVPGPPIPLYLAGAKMVAAFPLVATIGAAVNVTMVTYDGAACIGVSTDDRSVTDPAELIEDLRWGFERVTGEHVEPADRYAARQPKGDTPAD